MKRALPGRAVSRPPLAVPVIRDTGSCNTRLAHKYSTSIACAGYLAHPFSKETVFTLECRRCDPSFPAFFPGSRSLHEGYGCLDHDDFSACSPSAIHLVSRCDRLSPAMLLCISEAVFRCAGYSTFN